MTANRREFLQIAAAAAIDMGRRGPHQVYEFFGAPHQVGFQHGRALKNEILGEAQPSAEALARRTGLTVEAAVATLLARHEGLYREHMPDVLEETRGMAEGAQLSYPFAFYAATRDLMVAEDCTAVTCSGRATMASQALIGQTKDTSAPLDRFRIMRIAYSNGQRMVVLNYPGWAANLCLTSHGLSFAANSIYAVPNPGATVPGSFLKRLIMERRSVHGVLDEIRGMSFHNSCILMVDLEGHAVCLEMAAGRRQVRDVSGVAFGHANSILTKSLKRFEKPQSASSPIRQKRVDRLLAQHAGAITVATIQDIFRDHRSLPLSICRHPAKKDPLTTNAAFVADLTARRMYIAIGNPCVAGFQTYELPAGG